MTSLNDQLLSLVLQGSSDPLIIVDSSNLLRWLNQAAHRDCDFLTGKSLAEFMYTSELTGPHFNAEICQKFIHSVSHLPFGEIRWGYKSNGYYEADHEHILLIRWRLLMETPERFALISFHQRGRRRSDPGPAELALKNQQLFINQLIHELRTPLAIASGSLRRVAKRITDPDLRNSASKTLPNEHLQVAQQELQRITRLIDHLSLLTDVDACSQRWRMTPISLGSMINSWYEELPAKLRRSLLIELDEGSEHYFLKADMDALRISLNNLVDNAIRYAPPDQPVIVYARVRDNLLSIFVADWGYGIPSELREHVFDRFYRLEQHRDPSREDGSGLGLAVTKALINLMEADILLLPTINQDSEDVPSTIFRIDFETHGKLRFAPNSQYGLGSEIGDDHAQRLLSQLRRYLELGSLSS